MSPQVSEAPALHVHRLAGCRPDVLAHYLKGLGLLRVLVEQKDSRTRCFWKDEALQLVTTLSFDSLAAFLLESYAPTPLLAPWNGGSGFYRTWDPKARKLRNSKNGEALASLLEDPSSRFEKLRAAVAEADACLQARARRVDVSRISEKERSRLLILADGPGPVLPVLDKDDDKPAIQRAMQAALSKNPFFRSAIVEVEGGFRYPKLWGSGGNDGAMDFTGRFFENLECCLSITRRSDSRRLLIGSLLGTCVEGLQTGAAGKVGQFLPGGAGGPNSTTGLGTQNDTRLNPWDFVLMLEGAVLLTGHATRRCSATAVPQAAAPFSVRSHAIGYGSSSPSDEQTKKRKGSEQWMPLWSRPWSLAEVRSVLAEGRCQVGTRGSREPLDVARAIARMGVARGIEAFQRFGYIVRNGQANLAVPLGRWPVRVHTRAELVGDLDTWLTQLHRAARRDNAPASVIAAERHLGDVVLAALAHDDEPARWQTVLLALADVEERLVASRRFTADRRLWPIPPLRPGWVRAIDDGSAEVRLALSLAGAAAEHRAGLPNDSVRRHWLPLDERERGFAVHESGLANDPRVVCRGRDPEADLIALVERRLVEASQSQRRVLPIDAAPGCAARGEDLARLVAGELNLVRCVGMARALMALNWREWKRARCELRPTAPNEVDPAAVREPDDLWKVVRLANLAWPLRDQQAIAADPSVVRRLAAGDGAKAVELALHRLRVAGIVPGFRSGALSPEHARRIVASLAFPISLQDARRWAASLSPQTNTSRS